jgi:hypothetical protein
MVYDTSSNGGEAGRTPFSRFLSGGFDLPRRNAVGHRSYVDVGLLQDGYLPISVAKLSSGNEHFVAKLPGGLIVAPREWLGPRVESAFTAPTDYTKVRRGLTVDAFGWMQALRGSTSASKGPLEPKSA